jgi:hypothetical protein
MPYWKENKESDAIPCSIKTAKEQKKTKRILGRKF